MTNFAKSLATLVKYNGGFFKSEKQASFLLAAIGSELVVSNTFSLGQEYNNKIVGHNARTVYTLDNQGVATVIKYNSKGKTTLFDRNDKKSVEANKAKLAEIEARLERGAKLKALYTEIAHIESFLVAAKTHMNSVFDQSGILAAEDVTVVPEYLYIKSVKAYCKTLDNSLEKLHFEARTL